MHISINQQQQDLPERKTIFAAIRMSQESLLEPPLGEMRSYIPNPLCPLLGITEVDGEIRPIAFLASLPIHENMSIITNS